MKRRIGEYNDKLVRLHGRVVKGMGQRGHDEATEAGSREFDPRPGRMSFSRMSF